MNGGGSGNDYFSKAFYNVDRTRNLIKQRRERLENEMARLRQMKSHAL